MKLTTTVILAVCFVACSSSEPRKILVPINSNVSLTQTRAPSIVLKEPIVDTGSPICPHDMVFVSGEYCSKPNHDQSQYDETGIGDPQCEIWMEKPCDQGGTHPSCMFARCKKYKATSSMCLGETVHKEFCMDKIEYTNPGDLLPLTMSDPLRHNEPVNFTHAEKVCAENGKRLCYETEFEFACQGEENFPYSTGYERPDLICNIDIEKDIGGPGDRMRKDLLVPSGSLKDCKSPFGIYDLNGNADEITIRDRSPAPSNSKETGKHKNALKGGHYAPVRNRCHPTTTAHDDGYYNTVTTFRCCTDPK